ncbi:MAG TPA: ankyrin repeat domain-containing protein, partial [Vicinamibacteria bacterium]|nr:ankyrin repeat domain-containing protein [Vicinamibacteria bacterium]
MSKETRQRIDEIKAAVRRDPGRVDAPDADGQPPLHRAVLDGLVSLQTWLLDHRADPNARNARGETALHLAALADHSPDRRTIRTLVRRGADPDASRDDGASPLHVAATFGTRASVWALLEGGADPRRRTHRGDTPLHGAATPQPDRSPEDARAIIAELVARGAGPDAANGSGLAPLHLAAMFGHVHVLQALLDAGAGVDVEGPGRATALALAATSGHAPAVAALLARGADPGHRDDDGRTPLEAALARPAMRYSA